MKYPPLLVSRTDALLLVKLLEKCASIIDARSSRTSEQDKARQCRKFIKKINKKIAL